MPIKLPKGFARRKSSGNALEDVQAPGASSFRVIERPGNKSFDASSFVGGNKKSFEQDDENLFRVSNSSRPDVTNR